MPRQKKIVVEEPKNAKLPINGFFAFVCQWDTIPKTAPWAVFLEDMTCEQRRQAIKATYSTLVEIPLSDFVASYAGYYKQERGWDDAGVLMAILDKIQPYQDWRRPEKTWEVHHAGFIELFKAGDKQAMSTWLDTYVLPYSLGQSAEEHAADFSDWNEALCDLLDLPRTKRSCTILMDE